MRKFLVLLALLCASAPLFAQGARYDNVAQTKVGNLPVLLPGASITVCAANSTLSNCAANRVATYTDITLGTACPTDAQVVLQGTNTCVSTADSGANFGFWGNNSSIAYMISAPGITPRLYQVTPGPGSGTVNAALPNPSNFPGTINVPSLATLNSASVAGLSQFSSGHIDGPILFSQLGSVPNTFGESIAISDAQATNPCTGGGTGAFASNVGGGTWNCAAAGGASGVWSALTNATGNLNLANGTHTSTLSSGDFGASPVAGIFNFTTSSTSTTDTSPELSVIEPPGSYHDPFFSGIGGNAAFQVCNTNGVTHTSIVVMGAGIGCHALTLSNLSKAWALTASNNHVGLTVLDWAVGYNTNLMQLNTRTVSGSGFNFLTACAGASATDGSCPSGNYLAVINGQGLGTFNGGVNVPGDGIHSGAVQLVGNTTVPALQANSFGWLGFNSASATSYFLQPPTTGPSGGQVLSCGTPSSNVSTCTWTPASSAADKVRFCDMTVDGGLNAIPAGTYVKVGCKNDTGATLTITGVQCFSDNNGTSTCDAKTSHSGTPDILTGAVTGTTTFAAGTQSGTTTLLNGEWFSATIVADGTSKQVTLHIIRTLP